MTNMQIFKETRPKFNVMRDNEKLLRRKFFDKQETARVLEPVLIQLGVEPGKTILIHSAYSTLSRQGFLAEYQIVLADKTNNWEDTFTPTFLNGNGGWTGVPFTEQTRIRVTLEDLDLQNDDPIGTAIINYGDLVEAWAENTKFWINVATQTQNQLLFLGVVVSPDVL